MQFHITTEVRDTVVLDDDKRLREVLGPRLQRILQSERVTEPMWLCGKRGFCFNFPVGEPEELFELLGPEIYANFKVDVQPVAPIERIAELFQQWASEDR